MLKNYLKIAFRNLSKHSGYTFINITGLAVGLACCLLILLFVQDERSYDRFHDQADRVARVLMEFRGGGQQVLLPVTPSVVAPAMRRTLPGVASAVRLHHPGRYGPLVVRNGEVLFPEEQFFYADSTFFEVFPFPFIEGNPRTALTRPNTLVITASMARKYFGTTPALGQTLNVDNTRDFEVTGVIEDVPANAHFRFDFMASLVTRSGWSELNDEVLRAANFFTYVLFREVEDLASAEAALPGLVEQLGGGPPGGEAFLYLQPLTRIHLYSEMEMDIAPQGDILYVYAFSAIALLILLIACINYMNLATARSARRAREVGMRKALGAYRMQLSAQFFSESVLMVLLALGLGFALAALLLPAFNALMGKSLSLAYFLQPRTLLILLGSGLLVGVIAGSYPALYLSSFRPTVILKGTHAAQASGGFIRKGLVVFQFAVSVFLIIGTLVIYRQVDYIQQKKLGFDKAHRVVVSIGDPELRRTYQTLKQELTQHPNVLSAAAVSDIPGYVKGGYRASVEGMPDGETQSVVGMAVDEDVIEALGLMLVAGRGYPETYNPDEDGYLFVLNQAAVQRLGQEADNVVGKQLSLHGRQGEVVGVVADFHFLSLRETIEPLVLFTSPSDFSFLVLEIAPHDVAGTLQDLERRWTQAAPYRPFDYRFLDQAFDALYRTEAQVGRLFGGFAMLAIFIACLGLFGLAAFTAEQRTKEIGVRKVFGASETMIVYLMSRDFIRLVLVGFVLSLPPAYIVMSRWLQNFAYRIDLGVGTVAIAGLVTLGIAVLTVSFQALKVAYTNPVDALRYE